MRRARRPPPRPTGPDLVLVEGMVENIREQAGEGVEATLDGKTVLCGNRKLMARHGIDLSGYQGTPGSTKVLLAADGRYIGHIAIADTIKADAHGGRTPQGAGPDHRHADRRRAGQRGRGRTGGRHRQGTRAAAAQG